MQANYLDLYYMYTLVYDFWQWKNSQAAAWGDDADGPENR